MLDELLTHVLYAASKVVASELVINFNQDWCEIYTRLAVLRRNE